MSNDITFTPTSLLALEGFSDTDGASNLVDRKSKSAVCVLLGSNISHGVPVRNVLLLAPV